ncbi:MAG: threonine synthase [Saprospiraceae bacterium]|nr:threonine synthase [Saprospiraceae bacterium]
MLYYSTKNRNHKVSFKEAVLNSLAPDGGLYMPEHIDSFPQNFFQDINNRSFQENSYEVAKQLIGDNVPNNELKHIVEETINFPAPLVYLDEYTASLELWHGESLAFKDFGARFMSRVMSYYLRGENKEHIVLVATSGDTGGAVAAGFYNTPGIKVVILYPSGKVSDIQEKQLTTWGNNIIALEIDGNFDDCQRMVKQAFTDKDLKEKHNMASANSINIARLIPQTFYYFEAYRQVTNKNLPITISVPSGNFGNLTAGLMSKKMGLPVQRFIAATNANNVVPKYLQSGVFSPKQTIPTISNAMDVGLPSNFERIMDMYGSTWNKITTDIFGFWLNDEDNHKAMLQCYDKYNYITDPHGAIAYQSLKTTLTPSTRIFLETAHPCKFLPVINDKIRSQIQLPEQIINIQDKKKESKQISSNVQIFKQFLLDTL